MPSKEKNAQNVKNIESKNLNNAKSLKDFGESKNLKDSKNQKMTKSQMDIKKSKAPKDSKNDKKNKKNAKQNSKDLVIMAHIIANYPNKESSINAASALLENGAHYLEVQFPFSDGSADGVSIQNASDFSIKEGFEIDYGFEIIKELSAKFNKDQENKKLIAITYANIIVNYGVKNFIKKLKENGGSAIIVPDFRYGHDDLKIRKICKKMKIDFIELITPLTNIKRAKKIIKKSACNFIYCVSRSGITGKQTQINDALLRYITKIKKICKKYNKDLLLGFGINSKEQIENVKNKVDGIIVGSYFVNAITENYTKNAQKDIKNDITLAFNKLFKE